MTILEPLLDVVACALLLFDLCLLSVQTHSRVCGEHRGRRISTAGAMPLTSRSTMIRVSSSSMAVVSSSIRWRLAQFATSRRGSARRRAGHGGPPRAASRQAAKRRHGLRARAPRLPVSHNAAPRMPPPPLPPWQVGADHETRFIEIYALEFSARLSSSEARGPRTARRRAAFRPLQQA